MKTIKDNTGREVQSNADDVSAGATPFGVIVLSRDDGTWMEVLDADDAERIAQELIETAKTIREMARN